MIAKIRAKLDMCQSLMSYIRTRLAEKSTLAGMSAAVAAGAVVPAPYSYVIIGIGIMAVFYPEAPKK